MYNNSIWFPVAFPAPFRPQEMNSSHPSTQGPPDPRRQALVQSLRQRWAAAEASGDAAAKQALFREGVYLSIQPGDYQDEPAAAV